MNHLIKVGNSRISPREITKIDVIPNKGVMVKDPRGRILAWVDERLVGKDVVESEECLEYISDLFTEMRANPRKAEQPDWGKLCEITEAKTKNGRKQSTSEEVV